jgi:hypothetical protein
MPVQYNGFAQVPAALKLLLPAAVLVFAGCASDQPKAPPPAPVIEQLPAAEAPPVPVTDAGQAAVAADVSLRPDAPLTYVVKKGDTLWDIAGYYLADPWQWPQLWYDNPQIKNPHLIYPGDRLRLVWVKGRPRLSLDENGVSPERVTHLAPSVHVTSLDQGLPAISADAIRQFLHSPRSVSIDELKTAPYIVGIVDGHVAAGANEDVYVRGVPAGKSLWAVVEPGDAYVDPDTKEILGYEALPVGHAQVQQFGEPISTVRLTTSDREAVRGDRLLPIDSGEFLASFVPHAPSKPIRGRIISIYGAVAQAAQYQVVVLNRGTRDGVDVGTVFSVHHPGDAVSDPYKPTETLQLPDLYGGAVMVFKTTPRLSYALVMIEKRPIYKLDYVVNPKPGEH